MLNKVKVGKLEIHNHHHIKPKWCRNIFIIRKWQMFSGWFTSHWHNSLKIIFFIIIYFILHILLFYITYFSGRKHPFFSPMMRSIRLFLPIGGLVYIDMHEFSLNILKILVYLEISIYCSNANNAHLKTKQIYHTIKGK